ncbi:hypothetical protein T02_11683, partial [Trichinella nativa]
LYFKIINLVTVYFHSSGIVLFITMSEFQLFRFTENGISLMMGEKDTLKMTTETIDGKKKVVIKLEMVAEDMSRKKKQINLNFSSKVKIKLICSEENISIRTFTGANEESQDGEARN